MKRKLHIGLLLLFVSIVFVHSQVVDVAKAQSIFIYNFSRLIEWPPEYRTGPFIIGVLGTGDVYSELQNYTAGKKVGFQDIEIRRFKTPDEIVKCHIIVLTFNKANTINEVANKLSNFSTLIISEKNGTIDYGSAIDFLVADNKLQFNLKPDNATKYGLKISQRLKDMAATLK